MSGLGVPGRGSSMAPVGFLQRGFGAALGGGAGLDPQLFTPNLVSNELVFSVDPSTQSMFQDTAKTTPADADGQTVNAIEALGGDGTSTGSDGPTYKENVLNGRPALRFTSTQLLKFGDILDQYITGSGKQFSIFGLITGKTSGDVTNFLMKLGDGNHGENTREFGLRVGADMNLGFVAYYTPDTSNFRGSQTTVAIPSGSPFVFSFSFDETVPFNNIWRMKFWLDGQWEESDQFLSSGSIGDIDDTPSQLCINGAFGSSGPHVYGSTFDLVELYVFEGLLSVADRISLHDFLLWHKGDLASQPVVDGQRRSDWLLDDEYTYNNTAALGIETPIKYVSNPVLDDEGGVHTWDLDKGWPAVIPASGGGLDLWYTGLASASDFQACFANSVDGVSFSRPDLNLVSWGGNTNNNIILGPENAKTMQTDVIWDEENQRYLHLFEQVNGTQNIYIYTSPDGKNLSLAKQINTTSTREPKSIVRLPEGTWGVFVTIGHGSDLREIMMYKSRTMDLTGAWSDIPTTLTTSVSTDQKYYLKVRNIGGLLFGLVGVYDSTLANGRFPREDLYVSRDGYNWTKAKNEWVGFSDGEWDGGTHLFCVNPWARSDNKDRWYYSATLLDHDDSIPRSGYIGYAQLDRNRYGFAQNGVLETAPVSGENLYVNAEATAMTVAVINPDTGLAVSGFDDSDMDAVGSDVIDQKITWGGQQLPHGRHRLKFTIGATDKLYHYKVAA